MAGDALLNTACEKQQHLQQQLQKLDCTQIQWQAPYTSILQGFRNKAKMAVSGMVERPILSHPQSEADLTDCPLYPAHFTNIFTILRDFIARAGLVPYNIQKQKGELKYILLTESQLDGGLMLRFVLRSEKKIAFSSARTAWVISQIATIKSGQFKYSTATCRHFRRGKRDFSHGTTHARRVF